MTVADVAYLEDLKLLVWFGDGGLPMQASGKPWWLYPLPTPLDKYNRNVDS